MNTENEKILTPQTGVALAILLSIDIIQLAIGALDYITVILGSLINFILGVGIGFGVFIYLSMKGMMNVKVGMVLLGCIAGKGVPFLSLVPTWTALMLYATALAKAPALAGKMGISPTVVNTVKKVINK